MALRKNLVQLSGRIEWKADEVRHVDFKNGTIEDFYKIRLSVKRVVKKDEPLAYDSIYVEFTGKDAFFAKTYLQVGNYISVEGACFTSRIEREENGAKIYENRYVIRVTDFSIAKNLYYNNNEITIMGYAAKDPVELSGGSVVVIPVIVNRKGGSSNVDCFNVKVFGDSTIAYVKKTYRKGSGILVKGRIQTAYLKDGVWHNQAEIVSSPGGVMNPIGMMQGADTLQAPESEGVPKEETRKEDISEPQHVVSTSPPVSEELSDFENGILDDLGIDLNDVTNLFG